ncbi:MAG: Abi family protein [Actinomycetota bacterium]|nr:Abi family protein [Actinomycetota bacterium]
MPQAHLKDPCMRPEQVTNWLGEARFRAYLEASAGEHERAVALYNWNAKISAAFLEIISHLEVLFRNSIDRQFDATDPDIPLTILSPEPWLCDPTLLTVESRERVNEAISRLQRERKPPTRDRVVASLSFGFWQALFSGVYEDLWRTRLSSAFPHGTGRRREVARLSGPILHFRNRIAHHEAIFSSDLRARHRQISTLAGIIDPEAARYIEEISRVEKLLLEMP